MIMNRLSMRLSVASVLLGITLGSATTDSRADEPASAAASASTAGAAAPPPAAAVDSDFDDDDADEPATGARHGRDLHDRFQWHRHRGQQDHGNNVVGIGHDARLPSGQRALSVVSVLGSSTSAGEAEDVVSIIGDTRVTGPVADNAVAVLGSTYVDGHIEGDAIAVVGDVNLGPQAEVGGDVVAVLGAVHRDPAAVVHGAEDNIFSGTVGDTTWLHVWVKHCLLLGRPLALAPGLGWAWGLALGFLAFYAVLAWFFRPALAHCVETVEREPRHTALAALLTMLLVPILVVLLCVTVIGIAAVPIVVLALFCAVLFGKAVMLAWIGRRIIGQRPGPLGHPASAVLIGGALVLVLYLVPVLGILVYKLLDIFGLGVVVYVLMMSERARQIAKSAQQRVQAAPPKTATATAAASGDAAQHAGVASQAASPVSGPATSTEAAGPGAAAAGPGATTAGRRPPSAAMPRAGFWVRMAALLLDVILVGFVSSLAHPFGHLHLLVLAAYGAVMWKLRGATVGGIVFDLHVVRVDGRAVDWETAIVRALGCFLSLAVVGLGFFWIAIDDANQGWHDKIAGTLVVRAPKAIPLP